MGNSGLLRKEHMKWVMLMIIVDSVVATVVSRNSALNESVINNNYRMDWTRYHPIEDIYDYLNNLANNLPDICSIITIGYSIEKRPLQVLRISNSKATNASAMWIEAVIYGRDWITLEAAIYIIECLVESSYALEIDYYILPVANPDGYVYSYQYDRSWKKNRRKGNDCVGVNLNRNFGYRWGEEGSSSNMCDETYRGDKPFSEPETDAIKKFFESSSANFKAYASFYSHGQYILYPWGYDHYLPPDYRDLAAIGLEVAKYMKQKGGDNNEYIVDNSATILGPIAGNSIDWAKKNHNIKYSYIIKLIDKPQSIISAKEALAAVQILTYFIKT